MSQIEKLPEEIFNFILPYLGGMGFLQLRRTCWRLKNICDRIEISSEPVLWYTYITQDFPRPMVESAAPLLNSRSKKDEVYWKELYVELSAARRLKYGATYSDLKLKTDSVHHFSNVCFLYGHLFVTEANSRKVKFVKFGENLRHSLVFSESDVAVTDQTVKFMDVCKKLLIQELRKFSQESVEDLEIQLTKLCVSPVETDAYNQQYGCKGFSSWTDCSITYNKLDPFGGKTFDINDPNDLISIHLSLDLYIRKIKQIVFNNNQVVIYFEGNKLCVICIHHESSCNSIKTLGKEAKKIEMMDNFLVVLLADGSLQTAYIVHQSGNEIDLTDFRPLTLDETTAGVGLLADHITDFLFYGLIFAAVSSQGSLYLSVLDSCDHESITQNCLPPHRMNIRNGAQLSRISATGSGGLKLAVLEQLYTGQFWSSVVHLKNPQQALMLTFVSTLPLLVYTFHVGGIGGTVASKFALRSAGTLLLQSLSPATGLTESLKA
ncbi:hypothetical protein PoB_007008200 [Plakobranchus ocellatus]|uniref:F-box domain-containing protein n=1 Tax=Plakobranchus ocellatus TaxID=259542 RepID=A0AAV4DH59_9GAST|nr:hypothetical protein PoB_007008200 [Plakobranchus ocellatus]